MAEGLERRVATETNEARSLRSAAVVKPVRLPAGGSPASSPRLPNMPVVDTTAARVYDTFGRYFDGQLAQAVKLKQERSMLDGTMAAQQGKAFEDAEVQGDKWAMEGYRLVDAQRMASSLMTAQQMEIAQAGYELSPDEYRARMMQRSEAVLNEAGADPRTAELARAQLLKQMPVLVDRHMVEHLEWKERRNFETLESSIDTISQDPTAGDALLSFAKGEAGSATAGLSEDRRREAVTAGITRAFHNDNPVAYGILAGSGMLKDMPVAQQQKIEAAKRQFEGRNRERYNADLMAGEKKLMDQIAAGDMEPQAAAEAYVDLYANHNITINQQEAGAIYGAAGDGVRTKKVTTGMLIDEANMRGDRATEVNLIKASLTGTESSGNSASYRTNKDGRSFGGLLQMGQGRLDMYNSQRGTNHTVAGFKNLSGPEQQAVNDWQINSLLDNIEDWGLDKAVGTEINGVTVTRSGLVAVGHLGGPEGMRKFVESNGAYNPSDELGTSLTDYLRKHATGNAKQFQSPSQQQRAVADRIAVIREQAAIETYEKTQPLLDAAIEEYRETGDKEKYASTTTAIREEYNLQRTMAGAQRDVALTKEVQAEAQSVLDEQAAFAADVRLKSAVSGFESVMKKYASGQASQQDVLDAQSALNAERVAIREEYDIPMSARAESSEVDRQVASIERSVKELRQNQIDAGLIQGAVVSGTLDELPRNLQDKAVQQANARAQASVQDAVESDPETDAGTLFDKHMLDFYAQSGLVDDRRRRVLNGFFAQGMVDDKGAPSQGYVEAANFYRDLRVRNPALAEKYVEAEHQNDLDAILEMAAGGPMEGAVVSVGRAKANFPRLQPTDEWMLQPSVQQTIDAEVNKYLNKSDIGVIDAILSPNADIQQVANTSPFDRYLSTSENNKAVVRERISVELSKAHRDSPYLAASALRDAAGGRVQERTPVIGGIAVPLPMDGPSAGEMFFGARSADFTDQTNSINDAVMDHFRSEEFRKQYPFVNETTFAETLPDWMPGRGAETGTLSDVLQTTMTGVRPFQTTYDSYSGKLAVIFSLPSGGYSNPIPLDARSIGQKYIKQHTISAAGDN